MHADITPFRSACKRVLFVDCIVRIEISSVAFCHVSANSCNKQYFFGLLTLLNGFRVVGLGRAIWVTVAKHVNRVSSRGWREESARRKRPSATSFSALLAAARPLQPALVHRLGSLIVLISDPTLYSHSGLLYLAHSTQEFTWVTSELFWGICQT